METNFKPILFSTPMVQAIINGQKKQTRRIIKHKNSIEEIYPVVRCLGNEKYWGKYVLRDEFGEDFLIKPKYQIGDILWVRETFCPVTIGYAYKADGVYIEKHPAWVWKPSIFMPKEACRIFLKVENIRFQRLNDITRDDAIAEGVENWYEKYHFCQRYKDYTGVTNGFFDESVREGCSAPEASFRSLWAKINGFDSLNSNPFVWVYEFEFLNRPLFNIKPDLTSAAQIL